MRSTRTGAELVAARRWLAAIAARQHGLVATRQILALGFTHDWIAGAVRRGELHRIHRGVYAVGHPRLTQRGRWMAAVLACGPGALLSHRSAIALHELHGAPARPVDVTATGPRHHDGIHCHTTRAKLDRVVIDGIPATTLERALLDYAATESPRRLRTALETAERSGRLDARKLGPVMAKAAGHRGIGALRAQLDPRADETPWTRHELERRFLDLVHDAGLPEPRVNVLVDGDLVDFYWPDAELIVETDSFTFHRTRASFEGDRGKDNAQAVAGRRTIRPTWRRIVGDPAGLQRDLRILLAGARRER